MSAAVALLGAAVLVGLMASARGRWLLAWLAPLTAAWVLAGLWVVGTVWS